MQGHVETDRLGGLEIDDKFKLNWCLHWKLGWVLAFENAIHINSPMRLSSECNNFGYFNHLGLNYFTLLSYKDHLGAVVFVATPLMIIALFFLLIREPAMSVIDYLVGIFVLSEFVFWFVTMGDRLAPIRPFVNDVINYSSPDQLAFKGSIPDNGNGV
jgi:hypothetical protein